MARAVFGLQPVREAIRVHGKAIERLLLQQGGGPTLDALRRFAESRGIAVDVVARSELDRRTAGGRHQGVLALAADLTLLGIEQIPIDADAVLVCLDGIMDPQNFGATIRSAVALGARAIVWPEHSSAPLSPATFRASAGAVEHAALVRVASLPQALHALGTRGVVSVGLDAQGPVELSALDLTGPVALVIGAEDKGLRRGVLKACTHVARLPMKGPIASLNASVAAALALYEVLRQRQGSAEHSSPGDATSSAVPRA